jgi:hypothetical protein
MYKGYGVLDSAGTWLLLMHQTVITWHKKKHIYIVGML